MKKTLVALTVAALAATSAQAVTVVDADGTTVDFNGSLRLIMDKGNEKTTPVQGIVKKESKSALRNAGSRFGVTAKHQLGEDFYALSRLEFRFNKAATRDGFGDVYAHRAYVGLGSKAYGDITFGRQVTIADDLSQANDYEYGLIQKGAYIPTSGKGVIRYDYKGIEGLQAGGHYTFGEKENALKNAYGVGALYAQDAYDVRVAYGHTNFETGSNTLKHRQDGYLASLGYSFGDFKVTGDFGYAYAKEGVANDKPNQTNKFYVSPGFKYQVIPASKVYGNYLYERVKVKEDSKEITHAFLLGVDYKFHKQVVAFVEGKYARTKSFNYENNGYNYNSKKADKAIGVGLRVFW